MATIKDVARVTGLSIGTVSNYINGKNVKKANEVKIREAINQLSYKPNSFGKFLRTKETRTIGVITYNTATRFVSEVYNSLERNLSDSGYDVFFCNSHGSLETEQAKLDFLVNRGVDAIVLFPKSYEKSDLSAAKAASIPAVVVDNIIRDQACSSIVFDDEQASYAATCHLIRNGHRKIGCLAGYDDYFTTIKRLDGYRRALEDFHIDTKFVRSNIKSPKECLSACIKMLRSQPDITAFIVTSSSLLIGFLMGLKALTLSVPEDISYITFDDAEYYELLTATPTYVFQDKVMLSESIFEILLKLLANPEELHHRELTTHLVFGNSVRNISGCRKDITLF